MIAKQLINHSQTNLFAIDADDQKYTIIPSDTYRGCLEYTAITGAFETARRIMSAPVPGLPIFVPEMALMVYATDQEREDAVKKFGSGRLLINTTFSGYLPIMQGSYKVIVNLSDNDYFYVENRSVYKLPKYDASFRSTYISNQSIPPEKLDMYDLIVVSTILRHEGVDKPIVIAYENQFVSKNIWTDDPILFVTNGLILFKTQQAAEKFIEKYNDFVDYFIEKSLESVEEEHKKDIERLKEQYYREKNSIMKNAILLSGTTIVGVLAEKLISYLLNKDKKEIILGIGSLLFKG
jgi:hypothetical protein